MSHNTPFRTEMCTFMFWMVYSGIWDKRIVGFMRLVYSYQPTFSWLIILSCNDGSFKGPHYQPSAQTLTLTVRLVLSQHVIMCPNRAWSRPMQYIYIGLIQGAVWAYGMSTGPVLEARGPFQNVLRALNLRAHKLLPLNNINSIQYMGKVFCGEFQRVPLNFRTKYFAHALKDIFMQSWKFQTS